MTDTPTPETGATPPTPPRIPWSERRKMLLKKGTPPPRIIELVRRSTEARVTLSAIEKLLNKEQQITGFVDYVAVPQADGTTEFFEQKAVTQDDAQEINREVADMADDQITRRAKQIEDEIKASHG